MPALRSVAPDEKPPRRRRKTVAQAARSGTKREWLEAMRDRIAIAVTDLNTPTRELASLTKRLAEVMRDLEALDDDAGETPGDDPVEDEAFDPSTV